MKLAILGGGGARVPAFVRVVLTSRATVFDEICLLEPDPLRRDTTGRLAVELAGLLGHRDVVRVTADAGQALANADFVLSAIRVGGDRGRVVDEDVALRRGLVGQETTGPGGCAMALRTIPVVLSYCELMSRCAPGAFLINFTNPAGLITQAILAQGLVAAVGVCDTPGSTVGRLASFLGAGSGSSVTCSYGGLNHLGWVTSLRLAGQERIGELLARYDELQRFDHLFAAFDPALVRRVGAVPTEYLYYFYDAKRYVDSVARAGASRGQDVLRLNEALLRGLARAFADGDGQDAWAAYATVMGVRGDTYMRTDIQGGAGQPAARARLAGAGPAGSTEARAGGYEGLALQVIDALTGRRPAELIINTRNGQSLGFLDPDDVVEVPVWVDGGGLSPRAVTDLPRIARGLAMQVKEYERGIVEAAMNGDSELAATALALHPLVPGITAARELLTEYRERHGQHLAYLR